MYLVHDTLKSRFYSFTLDSFLFFVSLWSDDGNGIINPFVKLELEKSRLLLCRLLPMFLLIVFNIIVLPLYLETWNLRNLKKKTGKTWNFEQKSLKNLENPGIINNF